MRAPGRSVCIRALRWASGLVAKLPSLEQEPASKTHTQPTSKTHNQPDPIQKFGPSQLVQAIPTKTAA